MKREGPILCSPLDVRCNQRNGDDRGRVDQWLEKQKIDVLESGDGIIAGYFYMTHACLIHSFKNWIGPVGLTGSFGS